MDHTLVLICVLSIYSTRYTGLSSSVDNISAIPANYSEACKICASQGLSLQKAYVKSAENSSLWYPLVLEKLPQWSWLDGHVYGQVATRTTENQDCAQIHTFDKFVDESLCSSRTKGYMCQQRGKCDAKTACIHVHDKTVSFHTQDVTWYQARDTCRSVYGTDLAQFNVNSSSMSVDVIRAAMLRQNISDGHFWIGLRRRKWIWGNLDTKGVGAEPGTYRWQEGSGGPDSERHKCVVLTSTGMWRPESCSNKHLYMCSTSGGGTLHTTVSHVQNFTKNRGEVELPKSGSSPVGAIIGAVVGFVVVVASVLTIVAVVLRRRRRRSEEFETGAPGSGTSPNGLLQNKSRSPKRSKAKDANRRESRKPLLSQTKSVEEPVTMTVGKSPNAPTRKSTTLPNLGRNVQPQPPQKPPRTFKQDEQKNTTPSVAVDDPAHGYINLDDNNASAAGDVPSTSAAEKA